MDAPLSDFVNRAGNYAKAELDLYGPLTQQNVLWAGTPNYDGRITQEAIDSVPSFVAAGLTVQQVTDAVYALEQIRTILTNAMPALSVLATL